MSDYSEIYTRLHEIQKEIETLRTRVAGLEAQVSSLIVKAGWKDGKA